MAPGARSKFGTPMFEPKAFPEQIYCIEESTCDIVGPFRRPPQSFPAPAVIRRPVVIRQQGNSAPLPLVTPLCLRPGVRSRTTSNFGWLEEEPERNIFRSEVLEHFQSHPLCRWSLILVPLNPKNNGRNYLHKCVWTGINTFVTHCAMSFSRCTDRSHWTHILACIISRQFAALHAWAVGEQLVFRQANFSLCFLYAILLRACSHWLALECHELFCT